MRRTLKKTIALIIALFMIFGSAPLDALSLLDFHLPDLNIITPTASASDEGSAGSNALWSVDDNGVFTLSGTGKVTNIGWDSIRSAITSVIIETGITSIPVNAFSDCVNLESVSFSNTVTNLGAYAFARCCSLESVTIPGSVTGMGSYVFTDCGLVNVTVSNGVTVLGDYIFQNCTALTQAVIPDTVVSKGTYAFKGCTSLNKITLSSGWTTVPNGICYGCYSLNEVVISDSCTALGTNAFYSCNNLSDVYYYGDESSWNAVETGSGNTCVTNANVHCYTEVAENPATCIANGLSAYSYWSNTDPVEYIIAPEVIDSLGHKSGNAVVENSVDPTCAAQGSYDRVVYCSVCNEELSRETIIVPATGMHIGGEAVIENEVAATCGNSGKYDSVVYCTVCRGEISRETIIVPATGNHIYSPAVVENDIPADCINDRKYDSVIYCSECGNELSRETVTDVGSALGHSFTNYVSDNNSTLIEDGTKTAVCDRCDAVDTIQDAGSSTLTYVIENDKVKITSCKTTFSGAITLPAGINGYDVTEISASAFRDCSGVTSITIPDSIISIGEDAFYGCASLSSANYLGTIAEWCCISFENEYSNPTCYQGTVLFNGEEITEISVEDLQGVEQIGAYAFRYFESLVAVTVPEGVTSLGTGAFNRCAYLNSVSLPDTVNEVGSGAFGSCARLERINIPDSVKIIEPYTFNYCNSLTDITIGTGVTEISENAFLHCTSLRSLTLSDNITSIANDAFLLCDNLIIRCDYDSYVYNYCIDKEIFYIYDVDTSEYTAADYTVYNNHTYEIYNSEVTWLEARAICEAKGGHLVTVTSAGEQSAVNGLVNGVGLTRSWGGATDKNTEGLWEWITGEEFNYTNWADGEPNDTDQTCNFIKVFYVSGKWDDDVVLSNFPFICEYDDVRIPYDTSKKVLTNYGATTYARFDFPVSWEAAKIACEKMGGHLATITSAAEESAIASLCNGGPMGAYHLGATDVEAEGTWKWITGEAWSYTAWGSSQPDNSVANDSTGENYLEFYMSTSAWNDVHNIVGNRGFICEFEPNYVPVKSVIYNNHLYSLYDESLSWTDAEAMCVRAGGHLVSITSDEEQQAVNDLVSEQFKGLYWIGAKTDGTSWSWSSGETFNYSNWGRDEPNGTGEQRAQVYSRPYNVKTIGDWNDELDAGNGDYYYHIGNAGFVCEIDLSQYAAYKGISYGNNYYEIYPQSTFWTEADKFAASRGGHLISIADETENDLATQLSESINSVGCWYGGKDFGHEGVWTWTDGSPFDYTNWRANEPNNSNLTEHFNHYYTGEGGGWNDAANNCANMCFLVEYENAVGSKDGISWSYDGNILTLSGSGDLTHIDELVNTPWFKHIRDIRLDGDFDVVITPFKNTEWYSNLTSGPVVADGYLLDYRGSMPEDSELSLEGVTVITPNAFKGQVNLKAVTFGESLEKVCSNAFKDCIGLETVELSDNVVEIADNSFDGCSALKIIGFYNEYVEAFAAEKSFTYDPYTVTLTLNPTDGNIENGTYEVIAKKPLGETVLPEADDDEYAFGGWFTNEERTIPLTSETMFSEDTTIYAAWLEITSVTIKTLPDTLQYVIGDSIDTAGLVLTATYPNGETRDFDSGFICTPSRFTKQGKYRMKVDFKGNFVYFYVEVKETDNMTLSVTSLPEKISYETYEEFDPTGLMLLLDYGNGITKTIKKGFICDYDFSTVGTKTVSVSYTVGETTLSTGVNVEVTEADYVVYSDDIVCNGDTFEVPVKIKGNRGLMEISLNFSYDSELINPISIIGNDDMDGVLFDSIGENDGTFNVYWSGNEAFYDDGTMFTLTFESLVNRKCDTEIGISYDATETCNEDWLDINLICRPISVGIVVPEAPLFYSESIDVVAGNAVDIPIYVSNPLNLTQAVFFITYDKNAFTLESVNSAYGTTSVSNGNKLQVVWRGSVEENGVLFTVRLSSEASAIGQYDFEMSCENAVFEDTGTVKCRDFAVNVQNQNAARVYLEGDTLVPGEDIDVNIMIDNNPGTMGFSLTITYDSDILTLKTLKKCTLTNSGAFDYVDNNGTVKIVWNATDDITGNGALFKATFSAAAGSYSSTDLSLSYDPRDTFDSDWNTVVFDCEGTTLREHIPQEYAVYWHINDKEYKTMQLEGAEIWIPNVIPAHYTVVGWNPEIPVTMPPQEMHFTALLSPTLYTATFYIDGVAVCSQEYTIETEKLNEPEIPPKPYCFAKWQGYNLKTGGDLEIHAVYDPPRIIAPAQKTLHIDETYQIITSGNFDTTRYVWRSDNTTVATVDKHGNVTAVGIGTATIKVTRYGKDAFGNEVSAYTTINIKVTKEKVKYNSFSEWLKAFVKRFFNEIIYDILENLKRIGFILAFRVN